MGKKLRAYLALCCVLMVMFQQQVYAQALALPVENYVINRAVGGMIANRIAVSRGVAANDAIWFASAANDPVYKATMAAVGQRMTAVNVASTALGIGMSVAGAPVWLTIAAGLGVIAAGAYLVSGNTTVQVQQGAIVVSPGQTNSLPYTPPTSSHDWTPPAVLGGAQAYRTSDCYSNEPICYRYPALPSNWEASIPFVFQAGWYNGRQKVWIAAYSLDQLAQFTAMQARDGMGNYTEDLSTTEEDAAMSNCGTEPGTSCMHSMTFSWVVKPYWVFSANSGKLMAVYRSQSVYSPDNWAWSHDQTEEIQVSLWYPYMASPSLAIPKQYGTLDEASTSLTAGVKSSPLAPELLAKIADAAWRQAAAEPGYAGQPYSATNPITAADVSTWYENNPKVTLDDLLRQAQNPATDPLGVPVSPVVLPGPTTSPGTGVGTSSNVTVINTPNVNVVNNVKVDFGLDPGIGDPALEAIPTGAAILEPLINLFPELRAFQVPTHASACPKPTFELFGKTIVMDSQCTIAEQHRGTLASVMMSVWMLVGLFILLSA